MLDINNNKIKHKDILKDTINGTTLFVLMFGNKLYAVDIEDNMIQEFNDDDIRCINLEIVGTL